MSRTIALLICLLLLVNAQAEDNTAVAYQRIVFLGDILLARHVAKEIEQTKLSPWHSLRTLFAADDYVMGNLEGAVGQAADCTVNRPAELCFAVQENLLPLLSQAGIRALGLENNHAEDVGTLARNHSQAALQQRGLDALTFAQSPWFIPINKRIVSVIPYNTILQGNTPNIPALALAQKIRLAKQLSHLVVIYMHWGNELQDWPSPQQRQSAHWLIAQGADMIVGHHPHVIQPAECIEGKPVVFSLGNHLFDQKYPISKIGGLLTCELGDDHARCHLQRTHVPNGSAFPMGVTVETEDNTILATCQIPLHTPLQLQGKPITPDVLHHAASASDMKLHLVTTRENKITLPATTLLWLNTVNFEKQNPSPWLLTLQLQASAIDAETAPRPYVYTLGPHGLIAKWRGSALAWPLLDIDTLRYQERDYLCALHRGDSFINPDPFTKTTRTQVYDWNGFGFSATAIPELVARCETRYLDFTQNQASH
jgi:poly-gamma-glutamate synthesis protein (capsule biosynthesis protein)